ncbi:MAG: ATP-binding protein [Hyphomicrobiales bacterium]
MTSNPAGSNNPASGSTTPERAYLSWSSGKDAAFSLFEARRLGLAVIVGLLTSVNEVAERVAMHGVRRRLLELQAEAAGLPLLEVPLPYPCTNDIYEARMRAASTKIRDEGVERMVFGDLFLEDVRAYREERLAAAGMQGIFPLWGRKTDALAREMIDAGLVAYLATVDPRRLDRRFAGRRFDAALLAELPGDVDPCGENGEFHTVVTAGPMFSHPIDVEVGEIVERDGFVYADIIPV